MFLPEFPVKEIPLKIGYIFLDIIAKGAYGQVYKVQKQDSGQIFALKVISKAIIVAENAVIQSKQEVFLRNIKKYHYQSWMNISTINVVKYMEKFNV